MATKTTSRAYPFGGAAVVTVLPNAIAAIGDGNCGGDFLRQFADSYRHQTSPNEAAYLGDHVTASSNSTVESAMTCDDVFYIDESVADFTSPSSSPLPPSSLSSLHETTDLTSTVESQSTLSGRRRKHGRTGRGSSSASDADAGVRVPGSGARRNERERNRVRQVNAGFDQLRDHVPQGRRNRKLSKVDTLRAAVEYIAHLQLALSGRPSSFSQSGMLAAGKISISRSPVSQLQGTDGEVLRDINANTVVFNIVDGDGGRKHFPNSVFANEAVAGQYPPVPDDSSSSSSASVTELLFQLAASSTPVANENSFPVIVGNENVPLTADYVNPITGNETLYYANRPSLFVSDGVGGRQRAGGSSTGSVPLSSPARDPNYPGCYLSATSAGNDKASALAAEAGSMPSLDGGCIDDRLRDITSWLNS